nr:efflux RND transporter periplasmic adaptor subunit [Rhodovibrio sodomensis]
MQVGLSTIFRFCALTIALAAAVPVVHAQESRPTRVEVATVAPTTLVRAATAVGTLVSNESVMIRPEIAGRVVEIGFEEGGRVEQGQMLFRLEDSVYQAELADARARLALAERNLARARELTRKGVGTERALDQTQAEYDTAVAAVELARARLAKMTIQAPFAGVIGLRQVSVGDYVTAGADMVNLEDIAPIKVDFQLAERFLGSLASGQTVRIVADAFPERTFVGEVYAINPQLDPNGRSIHVRARLPNERSALRPGQFVRVTLEFGNQANALMVPEEAIVPRGDARYLFKVVDGKAVETKVIVGQRRFGTVQVVSGLDAGDVVVTAGQMKLRDGAAVQPANRPGDAGQGS